MLATTISHASRSVGVSRAALGQRVEEGAHDLHPVAAVVEQQPERAADVQHHHERQPERLRLRLRIDELVPAEQGREQHRVAEAGDREQLGHALEDAEHDRLEVAERSAKGGRDEHGHRRESLVRGRDGGPSAAIAWRPMRAEDPPTEPSLAEIARAWGRIGCTGFGGPPVQVALLRELCVTRRRWLTPGQFERAIAATNILPGPSATQLAIYCAWSLRGLAGALLGGACFIAPGLVAIIALAALFLSGSPPDWLRGAGLGAGAAVAAVAVRAGLGVASPIWAGAAGRPRRARVLAYGLAGAVAAALAGPGLALVLVLCGVLELVLHVRREDGTGTLAALAPALLGPARAAARALARLPAAGSALAAAAAPGGTLALAWTALKVGALAFGGGFVIVPLMQSDAVSTYHWMSHEQFVNAVALGQLTPGPLVQTVAVVGYAADGLPGALLAALVAFAPSFCFIVLGAPRFERLLADARATAFLAGAAPSAAGAIIGASIPLTGALEESWQYVVLAAAAVALLVLRRGVVSTLLLAGCAGVAAVLLGAPITH